MIAVEIVNKKFSPGYICATGSIHPRTYFTSLFQKLVLTILTLLVCFSNSFGTKSRQLFFHFNSLAFSFVFNLSVNLFYLITILCNHISEQILFIRTCFLSEFIKSLFKLFGNVSPLLLKSHVDGFNVLLSLPSYFRLNFCKFFLFFFLNFIHFFLKNPSTCCFFSARFSTMSLS